MLIPSEKFSHIWLAAYSKAHIVSRSYSDRNPDVNSEFIFEIKNAIELITAVIEEGGILEDSESQAAFVGALDFHPGSRVSLETLLRSSWISSCDGAAGYKSVMDYLDSKRLKGVHSAMKMKFEKIEAKDIESSVRGCSDSPMYIFPKLSSELVEVTTEPDISDVPNSSEHGKAIVGIVNQKKFPLKMLERGVKNATPKLKSGGSELKLSYVSKTKLGECHDRHQTLSSSPSPQLLFTPVSSPQSSHRINEPSRGEFVGFTF